MGIRLDKRVAIVTGAGRGLGRHYALELAKRGARVVVNDLGGDGQGSGESLEPARKVVDEILKAGGEAVADFNSVAEEKSACRIVNTALENFGTVDILINNAGILRDKTFLKMDLADFEFVLRVHLLGSVYMTKAVFPIMQEKQYGRIVMAASSAGLFGNFGQTNYGTAKMGMVGFMNALKLEGEKHNILVNTIAPLAASRLGKGRFPDGVLELLKPELVAPLVVYLASEACRHTGDILSAGMGHFAGVRLMEGQGVRFDPKGEITPEMIESRYSEITDMEKGSAFSNSIEEFVKIAAPLLN